MINYKDHEHWEVLNRIIHHVGYKYHCSFVVLGNVIGV